MVCGSAGWRDGFCCALPEGTGKLRRARKNSVVFMGSYWGHEDDARKLCHVKSLRAPLSLPMERGEPTIAFGGAS